MKITTNSGDYLQYRLKQQSQPKVFQSIGRKSTVQNTQHLKMQHGELNRLQKERAFGDALSVAQMSRSLIQKAIVISSQLQSIASQALSQGGINQNELSQVVSSIDSSLQQFGEKITPPITSQAVKVPIPDPIDNMNQMKQYATTLPGSGDITPLEKIHQDLLGKEKLVGEKIDDISTDMRAIVPQQRDKITGNDVLPISQQVGLNPSEALRVQGNLQQEIIGQLV